MCLLFLTLLVHATVHIHAHHLATELSALMDTLYPTFTPHSTALILDQHDTHVLTHLVRLLPPATLCHALQGAHVVLHHDTGQLYRWVRHLNMSYRRISSHRSIAATYAVNMVYGSGSMLTGITPKNASWFQLEADAWRPIHAPAKSVLHALNFMYYALTHLQVGPFGTSKFTDKRPLVVCNASRLTNNSTT